MSYLNILLYFTTTTALSLLTVGYKKK